MINLKTKVGFVVKINEEMLDDWELIELIDEIASGENPLAMIGVCKKLLGDKQYANLKNYLKRKEGMVKTSTMSDIILEIFNSNKELKN